MILRSAGFVTQRPDRRPERRQLRLHPLPDAARREGARRRHRALRAALVCHVRADGPLLRVARNPAFDFDIRQVDAQGIDAYADSVIEASCPMPSGMLLSAAHGHLGASSPYFRVFQAAQVKLGDQGFPVAGHHGARAH